VTRPRAAGRFRRSPGEWSGDTLEGNVTGVPLMLRLASLIALSALALAVPATSPAYASGRARSCRPPDTSTFFGIDRGKRIVLRGDAYACRDARRFARSFARSCGDRRRTSGDCSGTYRAPRGQAQCTEQIVGPPGSGGYARERCRIEIRGGRVVGITFYAAFGL
jgi:hypothetical protein